MNLSRKTISADVFCIGLAWSLALSAAQAQQLYYDNYQPSVVSHAGNAAAIEVAGHRPTNACASSGCADCTSAPACADGGCPGDEGCTGSGGCCGETKRKTLAAAVADSHKGVFYANKFDYLCDPCYSGQHLGDALKRMCVGDCWVVDVGGQYRMRYHREQNIRNSGAVPNALGLTGNDDSFLLHRTRLYLNAEYGQHIRFYGEMLDAESNYENTNPRPIEVNRYEMQNMFVELKGVDAGCGQLGARVGRQELIYGNQRLVSPLDWANTRRTFDAAKLMYTGENWDLDGFFAYELEREFHQLDPLDDDRSLYGIYGAYKGLEKDKLELYWLALDFNDV